MADFEEKLNAILSDPEAMAQIMQLAQTIGGTDGAAPAVPPPQSGGSPPGAAASPQEERKPDVPNLSDLLSGDFRPELLSSLLPLLQQMGNTSSDARALLLALRPYLKPERQEKVERALQLSRLLRIGLRYLRERRDADV